MSTSSNSVEMQSLCWFCLNSVPSKITGAGCSWSRKLTPVEGWEADRVENSSPSSKTKSYRVRTCPEFEKDPDYFELGTPICEQKGRERR